MKDAYKWSPIEESDRRGIALCLSGGGYRAVLFHLGALRRLNELGVLSQINTISSASGGSIVALQLAAGLRPWPEAPLANDQWVERVERDLRSFTKRNVRTPALLQRLRPENWTRSATAVFALADAYETWLSDLPLQSVNAPGVPRFILSATDMQFGVSWRFDTRGPNAGHGDAGYVPLPDWPLARAVAASSCFPPFFNPMPLHLDPDEPRNPKYQYDDRDELVSDIRLTDGGVVDNMGLEAVWRDHQVVLISNGGAPFRPATDEGLFWRLLRYTDVQGRQGERVRKRWLIRNFELGEMRGTYWGIESSPQRYDSSRPGYSKEIARSHISRVRTDLDWFSEREARILMTHAYFLADAALQEHAPDLIQHEAPFTLPVPDPGAEESAEEALRHSHKRTLCGRGWPV